MSEKTEKENEIIIKGLFSKSHIPSLPKVGDIVEGKVIEKGAKSLFLDLGILGVGVISEKEYKESGQSIKELKIGDIIFAKITDLENKNEYVELSLREAGKDLNWTKLQEKMKNKELVEVVISEANRGGLLARLYEIPAFLPVSQLSPEHYPRVKDGDKEKIFEELKKFIGKTLKVQVIAAEPQEEKLIISEKAEAQEKLKEIIKKYNVGDIVEGEIGGIVDFGVFFKFPQDAPEEEKLEGLIHISELDYKLIKDPHDIVKEGEIVRAKIIDIDNAKISLSLKSLKEDPWKSLKEKYKKGDIISGKIIKFAPFGAFVELKEGLQGLLHVSEFGSEKKMKEEVEIGKEQNFKVLLIDSDEHKIALGLHNESDNEPTE